MISRLVTWTTVLLPPLLLLWCAAAWFADEFYVDRIVNVCRISGYGAFGLLAATLLVTPLVRAAKCFGYVLPKEDAVTISKRLGLASGLMAIAHSAIALYSYLGLDLTATIYRPFLRSGVLALGILALLMVTSSARLVSMIRFDLWKPLHRLVYVAALLVVHHMLLSPFAPRQLTLILFTAVSALMLLRFLPMRASGRIDHQAAGAKRPMTK